MRAVSIALLLLACVAAANATAWIRFHHAYTSADGEATPAVDVQVDSQIVVRNLQPRSSSEFIPFCGAMVGTVVRYRVAGGGFINSLGNVSLPDSFGPATGPACNDDQQLRYEILATGKGGETANFAPAINFIQGNNGGGYCFGTLTTGITGRVAVLNAATSNDESINVFTGNAVAANRVSGPLTRTNVQVVRVPYATVGNIDAGARLNVTGTDFADILAYSNPDRGIGVRRSYTLFVHGPISEVNINGAAYNATFAATLLHDDQPANTGVNDYALLRVGHYNYRAQNAQVQVTVSVGGTATGTRTACTWTTFGSPAAITNNNLYANDRISVPPAGNSSVRAIHNAGKSPSPVGITADNAPLVQTLAFGDNSRNFDVGAGTYRVRVTNSTGFPFRDLGDITLDAGKSTTVIAYSQSADDVLQAALIADLTSFNHEVCRTTPAPTPAPTPTPPTPAPTPTPPTPAPTPLPTPAPTPTPPTPAPTPQPTPAPTPTPPTPSPTPLPTPAPTPAPPAYKVAQFLSYNTMGNYIRVPQNRRLTITLNTLNNDGTRGDEVSSDAYDCAFVPLPTPAPTPATPTVSPGTPTVSPGTPTAAPTNAAGVASPLLAVLAGLLVLVVLF